MSEQKKSWFIGFIPMDSLVLASGWKGAKELPGVL